MSLSSAGSAIVPFFCGVLGVIASNLPVAALGGSLPPPLFGLMPVYFWSLLRPDLVPPGVAFAVGLLEDLLSGGPPGVWTASFVASYAFLDRQRDAFAGLTGIGAILGFALTILIADMTAYVIFWAYYWHVPPVTPLVLQLMTSVLFYIPVAGAMNWIHRHFVGPMRSEF